MFERIRLETYEELQIPHVMITMNPPLYHHQPGQPLDMAQHGDLIHYFRLGGQILHLANSEGDVELFFLENDLENLSSCDISVKIWDIQTNQVEFRVLIWDQEDRPLELPFIFDLSDENDRYNAVSFVEQEKLPLHLLSAKTGRLHLVDTVLLEWPLEAKNELRTALFIAAGSLATASHDELRENGWAYQFDQNKLIEKYGSKRQAVEYLLSCMRYCGTLLSKYRSKRIQQGPFLFWLAEKPLIDGNLQQVPGFALFISPVYNRRGARSIDTDPCISFLQCCDGYIRAEIANPQYEGAYLFYKYEDRAIRPVRRNENN